MGVIVIIRQASASSTGLYKYSKVDLVQYNEQHIQLQPPIWAYKSVGLICLILRASIVCGSPGGLLVGGGNSDRSSRPSWSDLVRFFSLRLILRAATVSVSSPTALNEGREGSEGTGALFDGTRCGLVWYVWERSERLRRGASYGSRGRGTYEDVGPGTYEWDERKFDLDRFGSSDSFSGSFRSYGTLNEVVLELLSNHETNSPAPANEYNGQANQVQGQRDGRRTNNNRYPRKSHRDHSYRTVPRVLWGKVFTQTFSFT